MRRLWEKLAGYGTVFVLGFGFLMFCLLAPRHPLGLWLSRQNPVVAMLLGIIPVNLLCWIVNRIVDARWPLPPIPESSVPTGSGDE